MPAQSAQGRTPAKVPICDEEIVTQPASAATRKSAKTRTYEDELSRGPPEAYINARLQSFFGVGFALGPAGSISSASASAYTRVIRSPILTSAKPWTSSPTLSATTLPLGPFTATSRLP